MRTFLLLNPTAAVVVIEVEFASKSRGTSRGCGADPRLRSVPEGNLARDAGKRSTSKTSLQKQDAETVGELVASQDKNGSYDQLAFVAGLEESLVEGRFRLVLVLVGRPARTGPTRRVSGIDRAGTCHRPHHCQFIRRQRIAGPCPAASRCGTAGSSPRHITVKAQGRPLDHSGRVRGRHRRRAS